MNITELITDPVTVYEGSFAAEDFKLETAWRENFILNINKVSNFENSEDLLNILEESFNVKFSSCESHLISSIESRNVSELLGAVLMTQLWIKKFQSLPQVLLAEGLYYFMTPVGEVIQVNSNKKALLTPTQKFDLFNKQPQKFEFSALIKHYYEEVCSLFIKGNMVSSLKAAQTSMIRLDPRDAKWFARRGLLLKSLGEFSAALSDLKRFLSFYSYEEAPEAVKSALIELQGLKATDSFNDYSIH